MSQDKPDSTTPTQAGNNDPVSHMSPSEAASDARDTLEAHVSTPSAAKVRWYAKG